MACPSSLGAMGAGASSVSAGVSQSGSSSSTRPSASSSRPLEQAGACRDGTVVVVAGSATAPWETGSSAPANAAPSAATSRKLAIARISANLDLIRKQSCPCSDTPPKAVPARYPLVRASATRAGAPNKGLINRCNIGVTADFQLSRMCSLSCCDLTYEDEEQDGLRARA